MARKNVKNVPANSTAVVLWTNPAKVEVNFIETEFGFYRTRNRNAVLGMMRNLMDNGIRVKSAGSVYLPAAIA